MRVPGEETRPVDAALSIGGMVVARTMIDRGLADQLRADCIAVALDFGGWDKESKLADGKSKRPRSRRVAAFYVVPATIIGG